MKFFLLLHFISMTLSFKFLSRGHINILNVRDRFRSFASTTASSIDIKRVLVPIANGSEEIETVTIINTLVRAGASVVSASVENALQVF